MQHHRRTFYLIILSMVLTLLQPLLPQQVARAADLPATTFGQVLDAREMEIGPEATYNWYDLKIDRGLEKAHFIEFNPKNPNLELIAGTKSGKVYGMQGLTQMAAYADKPGSRVIAGINADFYDISGYATGVPNGLFMDKGRILNSSTSSYAFGLKEDGTTLYGSPTLTKTVTIGGQTTALTHINRNRETNQLVLYTADYYTSTKTSALGDEVVLDIIEGDIKSGQTLRLKVAELRKDQGDSALTEGKVVLSASGSSRGVITGLQVGQDVTMNFGLAGPWQDVKVAVGGQGPLIENGVIQPIGPEGVHPRTAIGTKADGTVVMFEVDGRAPGFSEGVETSELAAILKDIGVVNAINLDGGGSSTFVARMPGMTGVKMLNQGSDGGERSTGNGLLLVNKAPEGPASKLVVQPNVDRVLVNSTLPLKAAAVDGTGHPAAWASAMNWSVDPAQGTIAADGRFTAGSVPGLADIRVSSAQLSGTGTLEIVDELTELKFPDVERTFSSGKTELLSVKALRNGQVVQANNSELEWRVEGPIGTIDANGKFTATNETEKTGTIFAKYRNVETSMNVKVGLPPVILEDFEGGLGNYLASSGASFKTAKISVETNEDLVRFGNGSLKLEYDFTGMPGTSGAYLAAKDVASRVQIPGYPEKIGMWVYGDGKKHWLRAQMRDVNGAIPLDFTDQTTGVDWTGWKYVEATVPKGRALPLTMDMPVRYMETSAAKKDSGVLYVDNIRAVYGPVNDDMDPPILKNMYPAANSTVTNASVTIRANGEDFGYDPAAHPGTTLIDPAKIKMYVDGELVQHGLYPPEGRISYTPIVPLADGVHLVKLQIKDLFGNQTVKEWTFNVDTGSSKMAYATPDVTYAGNMYTLDVKAVQAAKLKSGQISFGFDPLKVDALQVIRGSKLSESQFASQIDPASGIVTLTWNTVNTAGLTDEDLLGQISYRIKPEAAETNVISFRSGRISFTDSGDTSFPFFGLPLQSSIKHHLNLAWEEDGIAQGYETTIQVTDETGVASADVRIVADGAEIGRTDAAGVLKTKVLTSALKEYKLQAVKEPAAYSPVKLFNVSPLAGTPVPSNISVTMGEDPTTSRSFNWHTHPGIGATVVEIVKQSDFTDFNASNVIRITGTNALYNTLDTGTVRVHKATVQGLEPGTRYVYRVGDGNGNYNAQATLQTTAATGDYTKFLYFADSQAADLAGYQLWGNTVKKAAAEHPDAEFMVHAGDMVDSGYKEKEWSMWFNAAQEQLMNSTLVGVIGNHEVMGTKGNNDFLSHFNQPGNGLESLKGTNFSFDYKNMHFVVLNSEEQFEEQAEWLRKDLAATDKTWKVVAFHRGPYGSIYDTENVRRLWTPVFDEFKVDLALNGHDHIYLRTYPMLGGMPVEEGKGTTYVIAGSTGPKFYSLTQREWQKVTDAEMTQMYASVEIIGNELKFVTKTVSGRVVDQFTLTKPQAQSVVIDQPEVRLPVGSSVQLHATVLPVDAINKSVTWSVYGDAAESPVTVSATGLVTGLRAGTAVVRAQSAVSGVYAESVIHVEAKLAAIELTGLGELKTGDSDQTVTEGVYTDETRIVLTGGVVYASSDTSVASVTETGEVLALKAGSTVISATYGGFTSQYSLTVRSPEQPGKKLVRIEITGLQSILEHPKAYHAEVMAYYSDGSMERVKKDFTLQSSQPKVIEVKQNGQVKTNGAGAAVVTAQYKNVTVSINILVVNKKDRDDDEDVRD